MTEIYKYTISYVIIITKHYWVNAWHYANNFIAHIIIIEFSTIPWGRNYYHHLIDGALRSRVVKFLTPAHTVNKGQN